MRTTAGARDARWTEGGGAGGKSSGAAMSGGAASGVAAARSLLRSTRTLKAPASAGGLKAPASVTRPAAGKQPVAIGRVVVSAAASKGGGKGAKVLSTTVRNKLEDRTNKVGDVAVAKGDRLLGDAVQAAREYLYSPEADANAAIGLVAGLERGAGIAAPKLNVNVSVTPSAPPVPTLAPPAPVAEAAAGGGGFGAWVASLSHTERALYGLGVVAAAVVAWQILGKKRRGAK